MTDYQRVAKAIEYIREHFREQPSLDEVAAAVHLSPFHFQRMFKAWAGISPKKFLQFVSLGHAKTLLLAQTPLFETSLETGLSGSSRLHDLFVSMEGMTPGEYKNKGRDLSLNYSTANTPFGEVLVASTPKGICHLSFIEEPAEALPLLRQLFPDAVFNPTPDALHEAILKIFAADWQNMPQVKLHLKGTPFQLKVWEALLKIPVGSASTYAAIAQAIDHPKAVRAVGSAVGANPIAYLIPCHRVIRSTGIIGDYHWGTTRKTAMLGWESCQQPLVS